MNASRNDSLFAALRAAFPADLDATAIETTAPDGTPLKGDDGEAGAGAVILKMLEREGLSGQIVVVTRWYGGVHLGGDRFAHIVTCIRAALAALRGA